MQGSVELLWPYFHNLQVVCRLKTQQEVLSWVTLENSCTDEHWLVVSADDPLGVSRDKRPVSLQHERGKSSLTLSEVLIQLNSTIIPVTKEKRMGPSFQTETALE